MFETRFQADAWNVRELLLVALISTLLVWYLQILWSRRRLYRLSARLPGPFAFPFIGSAYYFICNPFDMFSTAMKLIRTYPNLTRFWLGPKLIIIVTDPKYYEVLLPNQLTKDHLYHLIEPITGHGLFTAPRVDHWKRHRKIIMPTFNQKILDSFVEIFSEQAKILVKQLEKHAGKEEFDIFSDMSKCTLDIICETAMGVKINAQTEDIPYTKWTDKLLEIVFIRGFMIWNHFDFIFNLSEMSREFKMYAKNMHDFNKGIIKEKLHAYEESIKLNNAEYFEEGLEKKSFLDYLIHLTYGENSKFTEQELLDEVNTFIIAGSDTTASANSFVFLTLGLYQDMQQKVYEEIIDVVGPRRPVEYTDLAKLQYLERFIKETLRLFPIAGFVLRAVDQDVNLGDIVIPTGVSFLFGIMRTHTDKEYWPDPYKFDPDRFLPEEIAKRHPCAYIPFSYGSRNCIGAKYAMMAMKSLLATVVREYKIFTSYKSVEDIKVRASLTLRAYHGYNVSIQLRNFS